MYSMRKDEQSLDSGASAAGLHTGGSMPIFTSMEMKRVLVALPALNEEATVAAVINGIPHELPGAGKPDVLVVDDGSKDGTADAAIRAGATVISHGRNLGLGETFRTALRFARRKGYHYLVTMDSDGQFDPSQIPTLLAPAMNDEADLVTASRFADPALLPDMPGMKRWGNRRVARLVSRLSGVPIKDATCGYRVYGPRALERLSSFSRFTYTQEVLIDLAGKGLTILEVPVKVLGTRPVGTSRIAGNLWRYAVLSLAAMYSTAHDHRPWKYYGIPAVVLMLLGLGADGFVFVRWLFTGNVTPFAGVAIAGFFMMTFAVLLVLFASLADTASHNRHLIEEVIAQNVRRSRISADNNADKTSEN